MFGLKINFIAFLILTLFSSVTWSKELLVYSGRKENLIKPILEEFSKNRGINVKLVSGSSSILMSRLILEDETTKVDLYISNDAANLQRGSTASLFRKIPEHIVKTISANQRSADNDWIGLSGRLRVLVVNKNSPHANNINSVFDLAKPELKNKIGITRSSNESFISGVTSYLDFAGYEKTKQWLAGLKYNTGNSTFKKHSKVVYAVAKGDKHAGLVNHYYAYQHLKKYPDAPIKIVIPDQTEKAAGVAWNISGIAISKYTKQPKMAEQLIEYLASKEGQEIFAKVNQEYPTRHDVPAAAHITPHKEFKLAKASVEDLGLQRDKTIEIIRRFGPMYY